MNFKEFLNEYTQEPVDPPPPATNAGQSPGKIEVALTDVDKAYAYAKKEFEKNKRDIDIEIPKFKENYLFAQDKFERMGKTKRVDMPVLDSEQIKDLQYRLEKGYIDLNQPYAPMTDKRNPFPEGLKRGQALEFMNKGIKLKDGKDNDDMIKIKSASPTRVSDLLPLQKQVYLDKVIFDIAKTGAEASKKFYKAKTTLIASSNNFIIDGHHRYLGSLLLDPEMGLDVVKIGLPIDKLLPLTKAIGDVLGNARNK